mgnify:CR=1 FL=1
MTSKARKPTEYVSPETSEKNSDRVSKMELERRWLAEHADAIRAENDCIEKHGLPLAKYRLF